MNRLLAFLISCSIAIILFVLPNRVAAQLLPNLQARTAHNLSVIHNADTAQTELRLGATSWNSGAGPMELVAGTVSQNMQDLWQRIYNQNGSYNDVKSGSFTYHQGHNHFHFDRYAEYILQPENAPGGSARTG